MACTKCAKIRAQLGKIVKSFTRGHTCQYQQAGYEYNGPHKIPFYACTICGQRSK